MPFYVYLIRCTNKHGKVSHYTGYTNNIVRRFNEHREGKGARYFRGKNDLFMITYETFNTQREAMRRELEIKKDHSLKATLVGKAYDALK